MHTIRFSPRLKRPIQEQPVPVHPVETTYETRDLTIYELEAISDHFVPLFCKALANTKQTLINLYGYDADDIGTMTDTSFDVMLNIATMHILEHVIIDTDHDHLHFDNWTLELNLAPIFYKKIQELTTRFPKLTAKEREAINDRLYSFANNSELSRGALAWYTAFNTIRRDLVETRLINNEKYRQQFFNVFTN